LMTCREDSVSSTASNVAAYKYVRATCEGWNGIKARRWSGDFGFCHNILDTPSKIPFFLPPFVPPYFETRQQAHWDVSILWYTHLLSYQTLYTPQEHHRFQSRARRRTTA
jgi:hypothetical protein